MRLEVIRPHGFCAGVRAAIARAAALSDVYCLHELVHNELVIAGLRERGFRFVDDVREIPEGATVVFSAHGVSPAVRSLAEARHLHVIDTTCPFVARVHRAAQEFSARCLPVVVIGDAGHAEVKGILGELSDAYIYPDLPSAAHIGVVSQTTMNAGEVRRIVDELKLRFEVESMAEVCTATQERQDAVRAFDGDALVVLGGRNSANTRRLCEIARCPAFMASDLDEVRRLKSELPADGRVGVTSGASTPEEFFDAAVKLLAEA